MVTTIHVYSDASSGPHGCTGAYVIGDSELVGAYLKGPNSTENEMLIAAKAVEAARLLHPDSDIVIHSDLADIIYFVRSLQTDAAIELAAALVQFRVTIVYDQRERRSEKYRLCHRHARALAGCYGSKHPKFNLCKKPKMAAEKNLVAEALENHPHGASPVRIAQETGLSLRMVCKVLRNMEIKKTARRVIPDEHPESCDLEKWRYEAIAICEQLPLGYS